MSKKPSLDHLLLGVLLACSTLTGSLASAPLSAAQSANGGLPAIEATARSVEAATLDDVQRQLAMAQLDSARNEERDAVNLQKRLAELRAEAAAQPSRMEQLRGALALDRELALQEWAVRLPGDADAETLERVMEQERSIIAGLNAQIDAVAGDLALTLSRPAEAATLIAGLRRRIEELSAPAVRLDDESALLAEARRLRRASELRRTQTELDLRLLEQDSATQRQRLYELTIRELRYRQGLHIRRTELLQTQIADLGRRQIEALVNRIEEREQSLERGIGLIADAFAENRALGNELIRQNEQLERDRNALAAIEQAKERTALSLRDSRVRLELGGTNESVGRWLWSERRSLESPARLEQRLENIQGALADLRLRLVTLNEQSRDLVDVPATARALRETALSLTEEDATQAASDEPLEPLLEERIELLALLEPLLQRRIGALEQSELALRAQTTDSHAVQQLLDRHLLWIPSHGSIDGSWFKRLPEGVYDLVKVSRFVSTFELSVRAIKERPLPWVASLILLLALVELRRRAPAQIQAQAAVTRQIRRDTYRATARALGWTLIAALPAPTAIALLGNLLQTVGSPGRFSDSLGRACMMLVVPLLAVQLLRWTAIERGLGHAHFRWLRSRRDSLRRFIPLTAAIILPALFVSGLAFIRNLDLPNDVQARSAIVIACLTLAWALWRVLDAGRLWVVRGADLEPSTLRKALRAGLPLIPLGVALLALSGYVYSSVILLQTMLATFSLTVAITLVFGLTSRWILLGERRLAWRRLEERRAAAAASEEQTDSSAEAEKEITLEQIGAQTRQLLRALRLTMVAGGLIWVWGDVLPAFARMDEVALWYFTDTGPDGAPLQLPVTLMGALLGAFAVVLTTIAAKNLPGLIEIGLLSRTQIDAASRYAITSVLRYAIVITGTVIGLGLFGLRWSQLQWMAAALTVGLGFGLQEIFANFVSGLILLFERPFRVGDVITIGELSGRVTRIRTRATTIVDFDNKEIVVPNKSFITGQLINWTLSDTTTRVTIKVGVAYGTKPELVSELLRQAASENALVLADPEPRSLFMAFGASSLDFELRVFVATLADRLSVQDAINTRITELFAEHDIEIAFPQLDLHVRDLPAPLRPDQPPPVGAT